MAESQESPTPVSLTLVVAADDPAVARDAVASAQRLLDPAGHEIVVVWGKATAPASWANGVGPAVRRSDAAPGYAAALRAGLAGRGQVIAVTDGTADLAALRYALPLAEQTPVVWGRRDRRPGAWPVRGVTALCEGLTRLLFGAAVRDVGGGRALTVVQRPALAAVLPTAEGALAPVELLARAAQEGVAVADVPVRCPRPIPPGGGWRGALGLAAASLRYWWSEVRFAGRPPGPPARSSWSGGALLAVVAALILLTALRQPLLEPDEGRQAEVAREMLEHNDLVLPRIFGEPYFEKPPLQYWLTAAAYATFGVHAWAARLVPAAAAWLAVLLTFAWGRRALGPRPAFLAGLVLCLTPGFVVLGRTVVLDSLLALCVVAAWYAAHRAIASGGLRRGWWALSALACGLGVLAKGPVAVVLLAGPVLAFQWLSAGAARPRWRAWAAYGALALAVAAPWYVAVAVQEPDYLRQFFWRANVLRYVHGYDHAQPWWFYLPVLFVATLPWSALWPALAHFLVAGSPRLAVLRTPALGYCVLLVGWGVLFYSLSGCKSPPYMAPVLPPLALLVGACLDAVLFQPAGRRDRLLGLARDVLPGQAVVVVLALSAGCYLATGVLGWQTWPRAAVKAGASVAALAAWCALGRRARPAGAWAACALAMGAFVTVALPDLVGGYASRHTPAPIARLVHHWGGTAGRPVVSYGRQWLSASFYLQRDVVLFFEAGRQDELVDFLRGHPKTVVLVESGAPLDEFIAALPADLAAEVHLPKREGQAAVVVVRCRDRG